MDPEPIDRADQRERRQVTVADAGLARRGEVALEVGAVLGHEVPGTLDPLAADLQAAVLGGHLLEPRIDAVGLEPDGVVGPDPRTGRLAVAKAHPGPKFVRRHEAGRRHPAAVGHDHRAPRQPVAIVDHDVRVTLPLHVDQVRTDQQLRRCGPGPTPRARAILLASVVAPKQQFMDRTSQRERLESTDGEIFHQAKTHALLPVFPVNGKAGAAISDAIRDVDQQNRTASFVKSSACLYQK